MKKKTTLWTLLLLLLCTVSAKPQTSTFTTDSLPYSMNTNLHMGDSTNLIFSIKNQGPDPYNGQVIYQLQVDTGGPVAVFGLDTIQSISLPVMQTLTDTAEILIDNRFRQGINVVVVWPVGNQTLKTKDSLRIEVLVEGYIGIRDWPSAAKPLLYPNPSGGRIYVAVPRGGITVEQVRISNGSGILVRQERFNGYLSLEACEPGIYLLELLYSNGRIARYKIAKE